MKEISYIKCIRKRIKLYDINNRKVKTENHGFYKPISEDLLNKLIVDRIVNKFSYKKLSEKYKLSVHKVTSELKRKLS